MNEHERLLLHLAAAVAWMRKLQREVATNEDNPRLMALHLAEREVDALVLLHLQPSAHETKGGQ